MRWLAAAALVAVLAVALAGALIAGDDSGSDSRGVDRPPLMGVVEGSYGRPWTHSERMAMLRFLARQG